MDLTNSDTPTYVLPRDDCCILGGTSQKNDGALQPSVISHEVFSPHLADAGAGGGGAARTELDPADTVSIRRRCEALVPGLREALVLPP